MEYLPVEDEPGDEQPVDGPLADVSADDVLADDVSADDLLVDDEGAGDELDDAHLAGAVVVGVATHMEDVAVTLAALESDLADVERALVRLDEGTYGQCEVCGGEIGEGTLMRSPLRRTCPEHLPLPLG